MGRSRRSARRGSPTTSTPSRRSTACCSRRCIIARRSRRRRATSSSRSLRASRSRTASARCHPSSSLMRYSATSSAWAPRRLSFSRARGGTRCRRRRRPPTSGRGSSAASASTPWTSRISAPPSSATRRCARRRSCRRRLAPPRRPPARPPAVARTSGRSTARPSGRRRRRRRRLAVARRALPPSPRRRRWKRRRRHRRRRPRRRRRRRCQRHRHGDGGGGGGGACRVARRGVAPTEARRSSALVQRPRLQVHVDRGGRPTATRCQQPAAHSRPAPAALPPILRRPAPILSGAGPRSLQVDRDGGGGRPWTNPATSGDVRLRRLENIFGNWIDLEDQARALSAARSPPQHR